MLIGDRLVAAGHIDGETLRWALEQQSLHRGYLGEHLVQGGFLTRPELYAALARHWQLELRDLVADPPDLLLSASIDPDDTIERGWLACELRDGELVVATTVQPTQDLVAEVRDHFGDCAVSFVACTRRDLDRFATARHVDRAVRAVRAVREARSSGSQGPVAHVRHLAGALTLAAALFGAALLAPLGWVVAGLCVGALACLLSLLAVAKPHLHRVSAARTAAPVVAAPQRRAAVELPVYSVLVVVEDPARTLPGVLATLGELDYPTPLLDVVLLVPDSGPDAMAAVAAAAPPEWVRVIGVPSEVAADRLVALDLGLSRARGRYVVAYDAAELPEPDQLRRAVGAFETDLTDRLDGHSTAAPLMALQVCDRPGTGRGIYERITTLEDALGVVPLLEPTSTHFNMRMLRRAGGWQAWAEDGVASYGAARLGHLDSSTRRARQPGRSRAQAATEAMVRDRAVMRTTALLSFPAVLVVGAVARVRDVLGARGVTHELTGDTTSSAALGAALAAVLAVLGVIVVCTVVSGARLVRRRGSAALLDAPLLPVLWVLQATTTATALLAVAEWRLRLSARAVRRTVRSS